MRVALHVGQLLQPLPGGIGRYVWSLTANLPQVGVDVTPFAAGDIPSEWATSLPEYRNIGWPTGPLRYELWHRLRQPVVRVACDVIHAPSLAVPPTGRVPLVVTAHDLAFLRHPDAFTRRGVTFHRRGLAITYQEAAIVLTASQFAFDELVSIGFESTRIRLVPHGVAVPTTESDAAIASRLQRIGVQQPFALFVGTLEPRKGLDTLTRAFGRVRKAHPDLSLVVVGPQGWLTVPSLEGPGIRVLGRVDELTLDALYHRATLCAVPSLYEGFGLPALEAMARGCPVIASSATSLTEVVGTSGLLVAPNDVEAWTDAIQSLLDDPTARQEFASLGRARSQQFTWSDSAKAHAAAYEDAVEMTRP